MSDEETEAILAHVERSVIEKVLEATRAEACVRLRQTIANGVARIERICEDAARIDSEAAASLLSESMAELRKVQAETLAAIEADAAAIRREAGVSWH